MLPPGSVGAASLSADPGRPPSSAFLVLNFMAVYFLWGGTFFAMRLGVEAIPPLILAGIRHFTVGILFYPLLRWKTGQKPNRRQWTTAAISGVLLMCLGNGGVCWAERTVPSGIAALLVATVTLWIVIVDWLRPGGVRPSARVLFGTALGFAGMVILVGPMQIGKAGRVDPVGAIILIVASLAWACGSLVAKHGEMPSAPLLGVAMQGLWGGGLLWVIGFCNGEVAQFHPSTVPLRSWLAVAYLLVCGSVIGFSSYLYILKNSTAARVGTYAFVNPMVALAIGWLLGGEGMSSRTALAAGVILTAVVMVISAPHRKAAARPALAPLADEA